MRWLRAADDWWWCHRNFVCWKHGQKKGFIGFPYNKFGCGTCHHQWDREWNERFRVEQARLERIRASRDWSA